MCDGEVATQQLQTSAVFVTSAKTKGNLSQQFHQNPKTDIYFFIGSYAQPWANYCGQRPVVPLPSEDTLIILRNEVEGVLPKRKWKYCYQMESE